MPSLRELQQRFADVLLLEQATPDIAVAAGIDVAARIAIYRNNVLSNYRNALAASYPVVRRLVGGPFFDTAVDAFVRECPSRAGDLNVYGSEFAAFLARYPYAADLGYLADVARLEWALDEAQRAADRDGEPRDVTAALAATPPGELTRIGLRLEPSCRLVASDYPLLRIWRVNQSDYTGDLHVDLDGGADRLLVRRERGVVGIAQLDDGTFAWLAALADGRSLGEALDRAASADAAFDLGSAFARCIGDGTIAGVESTVR
jgi:hypothetical protein